MNQIFRYLFMLCGIILAIPSVNLFENFGLNQYLPQHSVLIDYIVIILVFAFLFYLAYPLLYRWTKKTSVLIEKNLEHVRVFDLVLSLIGLIIGLCLAMIISTVYRMIPNAWISLGLSIPTYLFLGYLGFILPERKSEELQAIFQRAGSRRTGDTQATTKKISRKKESSVSKLLDTSVIIDGRVGDLIKTGFLEGSLIIPVYVLNELQTISDSADDLKRSKGRRGLDIVSAMQQEHKNAIVIYEEDYDDLNEVDAKLVRMAKANNWKILTNDFNLNKVATVQGVEVLNINDLANAVKPVLIPGESLRLALIKGGKEEDQAIGYLDDGTMIVVENAKAYIGEEVDVTVSSVLQTSAGRMIFAQRRETPLPNPVKKEIRKTVRRGRRGEHHTA